MSAVAHLTAGELLELRGRELRDATAAVLETRRAVAAHELPPLPLATAGDVADWFIRAECLVEELARGERALRAALAAWDRARGAYREQLHTWLEGQA